MCGICGLWYRGGRAVDPAMLRGMNAMLAHRGPDGDKVLTDGNIGFGHRRLSIIDLSRQGDQPMVSHDRRFWLAFNGEMHNYVELRSELKRRGCVFRSDSDTEVVLHAFANWGHECFERFNGMWGIAIWDCRNRELTLSRDRFGIKPLCYSVLGDRIAFASEPKAILHAFPAEQVANAEEIGLFLRDVNPNRNEKTFYRNIFHVLPGTLVTFRESGAGRRTKYWRFEPGREEPRADAEEELRHLLTDSVRLRLRSDVPIACMLSGGLDSTSVTRLAAPLRSEPVPCFSLKYDEKRFDESGYSAMAADDPAAYRLHWVKPTPADMLDKIRRITWHHDAPSPIRGRYGQWAVMEQLGQHCKVSMSGVGADELLAGYARFMMPYLLDRLRQGKIRSASPAKFLREALDLCATSSARPWLALAGLPVYPLGRKFWLGRFQPRRFVHPDLLQKHPGFDPAGLFETWLRSDVERPYRSHLNNALWLDFRYSGLPETLHLEDVISMAFSVESRPPFLDHRLVEFCFSLPFQEKIRDGWTKSLLRRSMGDVLPPEIRWRRNKMGFPVPYYPWMSESSNAEDFRDLLTDRVTRDRGVFHPRLLAKVGRTPSKGGGSELPGGLGPYWLWRIVTVELWYRQFIDQRVSPAVVRETAPPESA